MTLLKELELKSSEDFLELVDSNADYKNVANILKTFLLDYFKKSKLKLSSKMIVPLTFQSRIIGL